MKLTIKEQLLVLATCLVSCNTLFLHKLYFDKVQAANTNNAIWSLIETGAAIIGGCLPTLRPLLYGHSPESIIGSIRFALSIGSRDRSIKREGYDDTALKEDNTMLRTLKKTCTGSVPPSLTHTGLV